jgi:protein TonB
MAAGPSRRALLSVLRTCAVALGSAGITLLLFLVLPVMQAIHAGPDMDTLLRAADTTSLEPPPPVEEPEPEEPEPEEAPPPELAPEAQPLDLAQLELALGPASGGTGWAGGDFAVRLDTALESAGDMEQLFSLADLDQRPRAVHQPGPLIDAEVRKAGGGTVHVLFVVDPDGRVENPIVQKQAHPALDRAALGAVKQWKFEPGRRNGEAVRFRMRVPITFPQGN